MNDAPVGIFDSGLGGLTAAREFMRLRPKESVVFFADTANMPYGDRDRADIERLARHDADFLLSKGVKLIIAACGTVSSTMPAEFFSSLPVRAVNILEPSADAAATVTKNGVIGVAATAATIRTGRFEEELSRRAPGCRVVSIPCPRLTPLIERGLLPKHEDELRAALCEYLAPIKRAGADTLILGCTHYALVGDLIDEYFEGGVTLVDSGKETAAAASSLIESEKLASHRAKGHEFYVSSDNKSFARTASGYLGIGVVPRVAEADIKGAQKDLG